LLNEILNFSLVFTQYAAIVIILAEIVYIAYLKPSKYHVEMLILLVSTLIMLVGYSIELNAENVNTALMGASLSYIGKPFALLMSFIFITDYCSRPLPKAVTLPLCLISFVFPLIVFTNGVGGAENAGHHLYYATVKFDAARRYSPMIVERGTLYPTYMVYLIALIALTVFYIVRELISTKTREKRSQLWLLFGVIAATLVGYLVYLSGITDGYDTTMTGAAIGTVFMTVVFFKYKLFDSLTLAKEQALHNASNGILVLNESNRPVYTNAKVDGYIANNRFTYDEFSGYPEGEHIVERDNSVYDVSASIITSSGVYYGKTVEISDITEKYRYNEQLEHDVAERTREIRNIQRSIVMSFAGIVEARDSSTGIHIKRMGRIVELVAQDMKKNGLYSDVITEEYLTCLAEVSALHDIGKLKIPDNVLLKPGKLTDEEFELMKTHAAEGAHIIDECLANVERPFYVAMARDVARHHHEKWNGTGYPDKLAGEEIPLCARIVAVADVYDALRSDRCYKPPFDIEQSRRIITDESGSHFDPAVVQAFLNVFPQIEEM